MPVICLAGNRYRPVELCMSHRSETSYLLGLTDFAHIKLHKYIYRWVYYIADIHTKHVHIRVYRCVQQQVGRFKMTKTNPVSSALRIRPVWLVQTLRRHAGILKHYFTLKHFNVRPACKVLHFSFYIEYNSVNSSQEQLHLGICTRHANTLDIDSSVSMKRKTRN